MEHTLKKFCNKNGCVNYKITATERSAWINVKFPKNDPEQTNFKYIYFFPFTHGYG